MESFLIAVIVFTFFKIYLYTVNIFHLLIEYGTQRENFLVESILSIRIYPNFTHLPVKLTGIQ